MASIWSRDVAEPLQVRLNGLAPGAARRLLQARRWATRSRAGRGRRRASGFGLRRGLPADELGVALLAVAGEGPSIDRVGFAQGSEGADEGFHLAGIGAVGGAAGLGQGLEQIGLITAGGFTDDEAAGSSWAAKLLERRDHCGWYG